LKTVQPVRDPPPSSKLPFTIRLGELGVLMTFAALKPLMTPADLFCALADGSTYALRS